MSAGVKTPGSAAAGFPGAGFCAKGFCAATACGCAMPSPRTVRSSTCARISRSLQRLFAPGRNDVVRSRVGDHLAEVLVQIAADAEGDVGHAEVAPHHLAFTGERGRIERLELFFRMGEALVQVLDDLRLVGEGAQ